MGSGAQHSPSPSQNTQGLGCDAVIDIDYDLNLYGGLTMTNIVTMGWELAHSVCAELPQTDNSVNYFPIEREPGKFAIGMFNDDFILLDYITTDKGA